jgi:hypothetical protein
MAKSTSWLMLFAVVFLAAPSHAQCIPDLSNSEAFIAYEGPGVPSLMVVPDGSGPSFTQARDEQGNMVNATITLYVLDPNYDPVVQYPFEDLWLETQDDGLVACSGGTVADHDTDADGMTQWVEPLFAGGFSQGPVIVVINGWALTTNPGLPLRFNSPDINGDLVVSLHDVSIFASDFFSSYQFRSDIYRDGVLNLSDIVFLVQSLGALCP